MITVEEFLENKKPKYKHIEHTFRFNKAAGKQVCTGCGLVMLRNKATERAVKLGCMWDSHQSTRKS